MPKLLVGTGGRHYTDRDRVVQVLEEERPDFVFAGCATGLDWLLLNEAERMGIKSHKWRAEWRRFDKAAGPIRNRAMCERATRAVEKGWDVVVYAFPGGAGTADCVRTAMGLGLSVVHVDD